MASGNFIINDDSCRELAAYCKQEGERLNDLVNSYLACMDSAANSGLISGSAAAAFRADMSTAKILRGQFDELKNTISTLINAFLDAADAADEA